MPKFAPAELLCKCYAARYYSIDKWIINRNDFSLFSFAVQLCNCFLEKCIFYARNLFMSLSRDSMTNECTIHNIWILHPKNLKSFKMWHGAVGVWRRSINWRRRCMHRIVKRVLFSGSINRIELVAATYIWHCFVEQVLRENNVWILCLSFYTKTLCYASAVQIKTNIFSIFHLWDGHRTSLISSTY